MQLEWAHLDNSGYSLHIKVLNLFTSAEFLLPCNEIYSLAPGVKMGHFWVLLFHLAHYFSLQISFLPKFLSHFFLLLQEGVLYVLWPVRQWERWQFVAYTVNVNDVKWINEWMNEWSTLCHLKLMVGHMEKLQIHSSCTCVLYNFILNIFSF